MNTTLLNEIALIIKRLCAIESDYQLDPTIELTNIPEWSSIIYVMLIAETEEKYGIKLSGDDLFDVDTIEDFVNLVNNTIS